MARVDALDSDTIETLLSWHGFLTNEGQHDPADDALAVELERVVRSRFEAHDYVPQQYSRHCVYYQHGVLCHLTRPEHDG